MKNLYTLLLVLSALLSVAQIPQKINYQGVARHSDGTPIITNIRLKFEILAGNQAVVFNETHASVPVNALGLFSEQIGANTPLPTTWTNTPYSLRVSIDSAGANSSYVVLGTQELVSVPFALNAPSPNVSITNNTLITVGISTAQLPTPAGLQNLTALPGGSLSISNGNTVVIAPPTFTSTGGTIASISTSGNTVTINSPSVTISNVIIPPLPPPYSNSLTAGNILGLAQIVGTYPNFSVMVAPKFYFNNNTGNLEVTNQPTAPLLPFPAGPGYSYAFYATPDLNTNITANSASIYSGPTANAADITNITPWRHAPATPVVTLATQSDKVGIGLTVPTAELHVDGYTKLGAGAPAMQVAKITTVTANSVGGSISIPLPQVTYLGSPMGQLSASKILSISMMAAPTAGALWIPPNNTTLANSEFTWQVVGTNIQVINSLANSSNILNVPLKILITFEQ